MGVNPYFNQNSYKPTQDLISDLVRESIRINGINCYYIPREFRNKDVIFGEDNSSKFKYAFLIEMYLETATAFGGEKETVTKFGLEQRDNITLLVSKPRFVEETIKFRKYFTTRQLVRPTEGDLIYFPFDSGLFEIKFTDEDYAFYQGGKLYAHKLFCERVKYSYEEINVNNQGINAGVSNEITNIDLDGDGIPDLTVNTPVNQSDNDDIQSLSGNVYDFTENDPFSEGNY